LDKVTACAQARDAVEGGLDRPVNRAVRRGNSLQMNALVMPVRRIQSTVGVWIVSPAGTPCPEILWRDIAVHETFAEFLRLYR
jgi:hypothetical protein